MIFTFSTAFHWLCRSLVGQNGFIIFPPFCLLPFKCLLWEINKAWAISKNMRILTKNVRTHSILGQARKFRSIRPLSPFRSNRVAFGIHMTIYEIERIIAPNWAIKRLRINICFFLWSPWHFRSLLNAPFLKCFWIRTIFLTACRRRSIWTVWSEILKSKI